MDLMVNWSFSPIFGGLKWSISPFFMDQPPSFTHLRRPEPAGAPLPWPPGPQCPRAARPEPAVVDRCVGKNSTTLLRLVVGPALWKIWVRQLGWLATQDEWEHKKWQPNHQPVCFGCVPKTMAFKKKSRHSIWHVFWHFLYFWWDIMENIQIIVDFTGRFWSPIVTTFPPKKLLDEYLPPCSIARDDAAFFWTGNQTGDSAKPFINGLV